MCGLDIKIMAERANVRFYILQNSVCRHALTTATLLIQLRHSIFLDLDVSWPNRIKEKNLLKLRHNTGKEKAFLIPYFFFFYFFKSFSWFHQTVQEKNTSQGF